MDGQDISNFNISDREWLSLYHFTESSNLRMIFDLNVLLRRQDGSWNYTNAQEIIKFAKLQDMKLDWQLGNGKQSIINVRN